MIVSNCPRCDEAFRIPNAKLPDDAYAQCPWCRETFPIAEVIHRLPPVLQVLSADGRPLHFAPHQEPAMAAAPEGAVDESTLPEFSESSDYPSSAAVAMPLDSVTSSAEEDTDLIDADLGSLAEEDLVEPSAMKTVTDETVAETWTDESTTSTEEDKVDFEIEDPNDTWEGDESGQQPIVDTGDVGEVGEDVIAPMKVSPAPSPNRRKSNGSNFRTLLSIVLGGLAAGPLAIAILWILTLFGVNVNLGFWPLDGSSSSGEPNIVSAPPGQLAERTSRPPTIMDPKRSLIDDTPFADQENGDAEDEVDPADTALENILGPVNTAKTTEGDAQADDTAVDDEPGQGDDSDDVKLSMPGPGRIDGGDAGANVLPDEDSEETAITLPEQGEPLKITSIDNDVQDADDRSQETQSQDEDADAEKLVLPASAMRDVQDVGPGRTNVQDLQGPGRTNVQDLQGPGRTNVQDLQGPGRTNVQDLGGRTGRPQQQTDTDDVARPNPNRPRTDDVAVETNNDRDEEADAEPVLPNPGNEKPKPEEVENVLRSDPPASEKEPAELVAAVREAADKLAALKTYDSEDKAQQAKLAKIYLAIAGAAEVANTDSKSVRSLLSKVAASPLVPHLEAAAPQWLKYKSRPTEGILVIGRPGLDANGQMIELAGKVALPVSADSPRLPDGKTVVGLGRIVPTPAGQSVELIAVQQLR